MATRSPSTSSASSSATETVSERVRNISETSRDTAQTGSRMRVGSPSNTVDATSIAETTTLRSASPSSAVHRAGYDSVSVTTTTSQQAQVAGDIPIIRPPVLQQPQLSGTGIGVFGPQRPTGYPTQPHSVVTTNQQPIQIDVAAAQQQYQQRAAQPEISPYSASSVTSSSGSFSSPSTAYSQHQQTRVDTTNTTVNQANVNATGSVHREQFQQFSQTNVQQQAAGGQFQQQAQFANRIPPQHVYNELLGPDAFKDVILDIDYGALGGFNAAFQSGGDFSGGQLPPGISIRPAYTTVDSLNYQQHMFNTARTINAGGESHNYDFSNLNSGFNIDATSNMYNVTAAGGGAPHFDSAKAIFNQVDINHDGSITRDEFRQWAQGGQTYSTNATNYGGGIAAAAAAGPSNPNFYHASILEGASPDVANILQQSGLGQVVPN